jgi:tetraacyldisaccharide 4'-kinase
VKAALERWLTQRWYGGVAPGLGLRSLAGVYRIARDAGRTPAVERLPVPVVVIGNFTAGGTGKTPLAIALARYFSANGRRPGIVSRGHGRQSGSPVRVMADTPVEVCGDEPKLMFDKTGLPVLVDRDRVAAARAAIDAGCDLIIADDGLQHRRLGRDIEIEVVDGERGYGNRLLLPAGPLREAPRPCDFRVVNGGDSAPGDWPMQLELTDAVFLEDQGLRKPLAYFSKAQVHAVAAIGNPGRFFSALRAAGLAIVEHPFEDHHRFQTGDFSGMSGPLLMTEKDAVKCLGLGLAEAWSVPVEARLPPAFFTLIEDKLKEKNAGP